MKVLVTGATGHIGTVLVKALKKRGDSVTAFVLPCADISRISPYCDHILYGDVRDRDSITIACKGIDVLFHSAGIIDISGTAKGRMMMRDINVGGVKNVLEAVKKEHVSRLVYISSVHALPERPQGEVIRESRVFDIRSIRGAYAKSKAEGTRCVLEAVKAGCDAVIIHPSGIIGPDDYQMGHIASMMTRYLQGALSCFTSGGYNFVDVRDVADGILKAQELGRSGESYILAGEYHSVAELFRLMKELSGSHKHLTCIPRWLALAVSPFALLHYRLWHIKPLFSPYAISTLASNSNFSSKKAETELHYHTRSFRQSIEDTILWCQSVMKKHRHTKNQS